MAIAFNHTIVASRDQEAGAAFLADVLGLDPPTRFGPFTVVALAHGASLDYLTSADPESQHYAFLVGDDEFDPIVARLQEREVALWADPRRTRPGMNTNDGGRGTYFESPEGHVLEILTRPYGSG